MKRDSLENLWKRGKDFLGVEYAIMGGAMSWISEASLVSAISNAGGFGVIASGSMNKELLSSTIKETKSKTNKPFGVNLITLNPYIDELVDVCIEENISHVVLAGGLPTAQVIQTLKSKNDIKIIAFAPTLTIAKRLVKQGVDALIVEGSEAGGHIGPVSTSVLAQEVILNMQDVPVFVAGGIATGEIMRQYLELGASGVQVGTILVCSDECIAHENFKKIFIKANSRDAQVTQQLDEDFPVIPVRAIVNKGTKEFNKVQQEAINLYKEGKLTKEEAQLKIEKYWAGALRRAVIDGDVVYGSLMAGQCVGLVKSQRSVKEILEQIVNDAN